MDQSASLARSAGIRKKKRRLSPFWTRQLHSWHWMSSAICLIGMLLFAITGITLNHAAQIEADAQITSQEARLPPDVLQSIAASGDGDPVPAAVAAWADAELGEDMRGRAPEWSEEELYVALPRPGGDAWIAIDRISGDVLYERTDRGLVAWLNDLHKGRDTGAAWSWFIDIFAVACVIFCVTGFFLLQLHARHRKSTWPIVGAGVAIPALLILLFMHN